MEKRQGKIIHTLEPK